MAVSVDAVAQAFEQLDRRPAVFDRPIREGAGLWQIPRPVPVEDIVSAFAAHGAFTDDSGRVTLPLHDEDEPELTGEFLLYCPDQPVTCVAYYDYAAGDLVRLPFEEFGGSYPAWRLRFWHESFDPPKPPSFAGTTEPVQPADARVGATNARAEETPSDLESTPERVEPEADRPTTAEPGSTNPVGSQRPTDADSQRAADAKVVAADALFEELRSFVQREREAEREAARDAFERLDIARYAEQAGAIPTLVSAGLHVDAYGQQTVHLQLPAADGRGSTDGGQVAETEGPDSPDGDGQVDIPETYGIYPGMEVLIDTHEETTSFPVEAEVVAMDDRRVEVSVYWTRTSSGERPEAVFDSDSDTRFAVGALLNPVPTDRQLDAISAVETHERKAALLTGSRVPDSVSALDVSVSKAGLNTHQYRAAQAALMAEDVHCIHGPPGTGKTRTLVRIIRAACDAGLRVLACAHSNQAVDNLLVGDSTTDRADSRSLHRLAQEGEVSVARAGSNTDSDLVSAEYGDESVWTADVVCATTSAAHQFGDDVFDLAVVDEATQATVPASLLPFAAAKRTILAGDHCQLPPYHASETHDTEVMEVSLFEHLLGRHGEDVTTRLRTQYRMHEAIAAFPNAEFYGGQLRCGDRNRGWTIGSLDPLAAVHVSGQEQETPGRSYRNGPEAKAVGRQVSGLLHAGVSPGDIGVITAYSGQIGAVRKRLLDLHDRAVVDEVEIATIDAFQGSERDAVVVSFVRSNPEGYSGFLTFPGEGPRRLNVALTRARKRCVLVGDFDTLRTRAPNRAPPESAADVYQRLYDHLNGTGVVEEPTW